MKQRYFIHIEKVLRFLHIERILWLLHLTCCVAGLIGSFMLMKFGQHLAGILPPFFANFSLLYTFAGATLICATVTSFSAMLYKAKEKQLVIKKLHFMTIENILHVLHLITSVVGLFASLGIISIFCFYAKYETEIPFANLIAIFHLIIGCLVLITAIFSFSAMAYKKNKDGLTEEDEAYWDEYFGNN